MKNTYKITLAILAVIVFSACQKIPHYDESIDFITLLESNEWIQTEYTRTRSDQEKNLFYSLSLKEEDIECYKNYTYHFNVEDSTYIIKNCSDSGILYEKSLKINHFPQNQIKWEVQFDTTFLVYDKSYYYMVFDKPFIGPDFWNVEYYTKNEIKFSRQIYFPHNDSYLRYDKTLKIKE